MREAQRSESRDGKHVQRSHLDERSGAACGAAASRREGMVTWNVVVGCWGSMGGRSNERVSGRSWRNA